MQVKIDGKNLVITLPIEVKPSSSGKSTIIATTSGNKPTDLIYEGKNVVVGCTAYIPVK